VRFDVVVVPNDLAANALALPDAAKLRSELRKIPHVASLAWRSTAQSPWFAGYELVIRPADESTVARAASLVRAAYASVRGNLQFEIAPLTAHCEAVVSELRNEALRADAAYVLSTAKAAHRLPRSMLLIGALPARMPGDPCRMTPQAPSPSVIQHNMPVPAVPRNTPISVTATMVLRVFAR
jgi:hypothetical protein